jgi:hypothetical protein
VTDALQNVILQHSDIRTFVRHYEVDVDVDVQGIVRNTGSQTALVRFACSLSASIDPDRPYKLSSEESRSITELPEVRAKQEKVDERKRKWEDRQAQFELTEKEFHLSSNYPEQDATPEDHHYLREKLEAAQEKVAEANRKKNRAILELRSEKQRQRNRRVRENLERYKIEQPVIDLERQLRGKLVDTKVLGALENARPSSPEFIRVIDTILTMPGATIETKYQRRIDAINAVTAFCGVEEGRPTQRPNPSRRRQAVDDLESCPSFKRRKTPTGDNVQSILQDAMDSVRVKSPETRPTICFLCVGNPNLPLEKRIAKHATPGSLTRHFLRKHVENSWPIGGIPCNVCDKKTLQHKSTLVNHAERAHGTVIRGRTQERLARQLNAATSSP